MMLFYPLDFMVNDHQTRTCIAICQVAKKREVSGRSCQGCWHSFHDKCLQNLSHCPLCKKLLESKIDELGKVAKEAIFNENSSINKEEDIPDTRQDDDDNDEGTNNIPNVDEQYIEEAITSIN